jgi:hypothetical protein
MSSSYDRVKRKPLKFKQSSHPYKQRSLVPTKPENSENSSSAPVVPLTGRLVASGTSIQGLNTVFKEEVDIGDILIVRNPQTHVLERRIVIAVNTNRLLSINERLSADFVSTVEASIQKESEVMRKAIEARKRGKKDPGMKGEKDEDEEESDVEAALKREVAERVAKAKTHVSYLQRTGGFGYKTVTEEVNADMSRSDLLDFRAKKVHDKYC